jgi:hypothetical protein
MFCQVDTEAAIYIFFLGGKKEELHAVLTTLNTWLFRHPETSRAASAPLHMTLTNRGQKILMPRKTSWLSDRKLF